VGLGTLDLLWLNTIKAPYKALKTILLASWLAALPSVVVTVVNAIASSPIPHPALAPVFGFLLASIVYGYAEGNKLNTVPAGAYSAKSLPLNIASIPILGLLEGLAPWYALLTYHRSGRLGFKVVDK